MRPELHGRDARQGQRRQKRPLARMEPDLLPVQLPFQNTDPVAQNEDLDIFHPVAHRQQSQHHERDRHTQIRPASATRPITMPRQPAPRDTGDSIDLDQRPNPIPPAWMRHSARASRRRCRPTENRTEAAVGPPQAPLLRGSSLLSSPAQVSDAIAAKEPASVRVQVNTADWVISRRAVHRGSRQPRRATVGACPPPGRH